MNGKTTSRMRRLGAFILTPAPRWWWSTRLWLFGLLAIALVIETQFKPFKTRDWSSSWTPTVTWNGTEFSISREDTGELWRITANESFVSRFGRETLTLWTSGLMRHDRILPEPPDEQDLEALNRQLLTYIHVDPRALGGSTLGPWWEQRLQETAISGGGTVVRWRPDIIIAQLLTLGASLAILLWIFIGLGRHFQRVYYRSALRNAIRGQCPACGYDMKKLGRCRCPECGADFEETVTAAQSALNVILGDPID